MGLVRRLSRDPASIVGAVLLASLVVGAVGCAAGSPRFTTDDPAGFWMGLWHGAIAVVTLVIGIFDDTIGVYERNNTGGWYDFGFILALTAIWGHSHHVARKKRRNRLDDEEFAAIGREVGAELEQKIREWVKAEPDESWEQVGAEVGRKIGRELETRLRERAARRSR